MNYSASFQLHSCEPVITTAWEEKERLENLLNYYRDNYPEMDIISIYNEELRPCDFIGEIVERSDEEIQQAKEYEESLDDYE